MGQGQPTSKESFAGMMPYFDELGLPYMTYVKRVILAVLAHSAD